MLQNIIDPPAANHAVLSQHPGQHLQDLRRAHPPALDQTYDHPQIAQHSCANPALKRLQVAPGLLTGVDRRSFTLAPLLVLDLLFGLAFRRLVVLGTAFVRTPLALRLSAPERTPEILTAGVTRMGQEENLAMPTTRQTPPQAWIGPQHAPEHEIVLQDQILDSLATVPARPELKMLLDFYA
jgi:hypothetical protein